jgi:hypothetical protein
MFEEDKVGIITLIIIVIAVLWLVGFGVWNEYISGNKQFVDFNQKFNTAYVCFPDNHSEKIKIKKWNDYKNSDSIQIIDENGKPYYTHLKNVLLTEE